MIYCRSFCWSYDHSSHCLVDNALVSVLSSLNTMLGIQRKCSSSRSVYFVMHWDFEFFATYFHQEPHKISWIAFIFSFTLLYTSCRYDSKDAISLQFSGCHIARDFIKVNHTSQRLKWCAQVSVEKWNFWTKAAMTIIIDIISSFVWL